MKKADIKDFLEEKANYYESPKFILDDPIQIPHKFNKKEDIEISAFLVATIAWGNRKSIINNGNKIVALMDNSPYDFICNHNAKERSKLTDFVHRTFNSTDLAYFFEALQNIYNVHGGLEAVFEKNATPNSLQPAIHAFKHIFFELPHPARTQKHVSDPLKGSAAKRINMFLRWMVRSSDKHVDFGLWTRLSPRQLSCPLDVHSGNVARKLKLLKRKQNDAKARLELDTSLRKMDPNDPVKYDFALFGLGVFEKF